MNPSSVSSHHFVREDQEPALIILDAGAVPFSKIQELLEWSPTVIVLEHALPTVLGWQIKIDVVIASAAKKEQLLIELSDQGPLRWIWSEKEDVDMEMAFYFLLASKQRYSNLVGTMTNDRKICIQDWSDRLHLTLFDQEKKWNWITSSRLEKWMPKDTVYQIQHAEELIQSYVVEHDQLISIQRSSPFWFIEVDA